MKLVVTILLAGVLLSSCSTRVGSDSLETRLGFDSLDPNCYRVTHAKAGKCPDGSKLEKDFFSEKDGSRQDACVKGDLNTGCGETDYLMPGEGQQFHIQIKILDEAKPHA
ncbi:MAG TPA: hypothetical protein VKX49_12465 [Bryobacteraceae bacterium]|nr:hypothetical protein [Bryobacteraceae bacterium]